MDGKCRERLPLPNQYRSLKTVIFLFKYLSNHSNLTNYQDQLIFNHPIIGGLIMIQHRSTEGQNRIREVQ
jgi:hypothetical protein